jgi:heterodisulfide reductase subunit C
MTDKQKKAGSRAASGKATDVPVTVKTKTDEEKSKAGEAVATPGGLSEGNPYATIAPSAFGERPSAQGDLMQRIMDDPRMHDHLDGFESCIQCGVCTSGCPAARFTEYSPREIARRALEGDETLLTDDSVWYCYYCYTCQSRCPRHNSVAVLNQIIRGMQCDTGYGVQHVEMFSAWGEQFYDKGMGGTPQVFFSDIAEMCGPKWKDFVAHRDVIRELLGLGTVYPSDNARDELQGIMDATGFRKRLVQIGAWGGADPKDEFAFDEDHLEK